MNCMVDGCPKEAKYRGVCRQHYRALHWRVQAGKYTWGELEDAGACLTTQSREINALDAYLVKKLKR